MTGRQNAGLIMEKRWKLLEPDPVKTASLHQSLRINPILCGILVNRGIETFEEARQFFRPQLEQLHDPWLMKGMPDAVERILTAINRKEKVLVYGDYDVDGTTSVACMFHFLRQLCSASTLDFYIPHRYREGYGISQAGIDFAGENIFTLIIALDCGIKSTDLVAYAKTLGIDFIICDHHLPDAILPPAVAILNPKQPGCPYPYKELCGCGVGFKLMTAISLRLGLANSELFTWLDLVATAIAADIVPLTGENRIMAFYGLKRINDHPNFGIKALMHLSKVEKEMNLNNLVFMIAPRVNAAGRMDDARKAVQLFIADNYDEALFFGEQLHSDNTDRKEADSSITSEALSIIENDETLVQRNSTVVFQPHWHKGVVGIVASRLIEKYYRPTVVLTQSGELIAGSARSVSGFNLYEAIHACREHLLGYGGHFAAAGMTLMPDQLAAFSQKFEAVVNASIEPDMLIPEIVIDAELSFRDINETIYKIITQMEPFGPQNMKPVFIARQVMDNGWSKIVKQDHLKLSLVQNKIVLHGIGFNLAHRFNLLTSKKPLDIIFTLDENEWNQKKSLQLKVTDLRLSKELSNH